MAALLAHDWEQHLVREGLARATVDASACPACGSAGELTADGECPDCGLVLG